MIWFWIGSHAEYDKLDLTNLTMKRTLCGSDACRPARFAFARTMIR